VSPTSPIRIFVDVGGGHLGLWEVGRTADDTVLIGERGPAVPVRWSMRSTHHGVLTQEGIDASDGRFHCTGSSLLSVSVMVTRQHRNAC
jgi:hypothetical protein